MLIEKDLKMQKQFVTIIAEFATLSIAEQTTMLKELRATLSLNKSNIKASRIQAQEQRAAAKAAKVAMQVEKAQARLQKLLEKQVGSVGVKAIKANKRPSKAVTYGAEDNAIAAAILARKTANIAAIRQS